MKRLQDLPVHLYNGLREVGALRSRIEIVEVMKKIAWCVPEKRPTAKRGTFLIDWSSQTQKRMHKTIIKYYSEGCGGDLAASPSLFEIARRDFEFQPKGKWVARSSTKVSPVLKRLLQREFEDVRDEWIENEGFLKPPHEELSEGGVQGANAVVRMISQKIREAMDADPLLRVNLLVVVEHFLKAFQQVAESTGGVEAGVHRLTVTDQAIAMGIKRRAQLWRHVAVFEILGLLSLCEETVMLDRKVMEQNVSRASSIDSQAYKKTGLNEASKRGGFSERDCGEFDEVATEQCHVKETAFIHSNPACSSSSSSSSCFSNAAAAATAAESALSTPRQSSSVPSSTSPHSASVSPMLSRRDETETNQDERGELLQTGSCDQTKVKGDWMGRDPEPIDRLPDRLREVLLKAADALQKSLDTDLKPFRLFTFGP